MSAFVMGKSGKFRHLLASIPFFLSCALAAGCNARPSPGIEAGNPNVGIKSIRVLPKAGEELYEVALLDAEDAVVSRLRVGESDPSYDVIDEVIVPYRLEKNILDVEASFANGPAIGVTAAFGVGGETVSGVLKIDGGFAEACFEVPGQTPSCESTDETTAGNETDAPDEEPAPTPPPPVIRPITRGDVQESDGEGMLKPPPSWAPRIDLDDQDNPYGPHCTRINGRPACRVPPFVDIVGPEPESRPFLRRADGIPLSPVPVFPN